jgi:cytidylate kinase
LSRRGIPVAPDDVVEEIERRDERDRSRADSPLQPAAGAIRVDSTNLTLEEQVKRVLEIVRRHPSCPAPGASSAPPDKTSPATGAPGPGRGD